MAVTTVDVRDRVLSLGEIGDLLGRALADSPAERAIVFGSYARGEAGPRSDVDMIVVAGEACLSGGGARSAAFAEVRRACPKELDLLVYSPEEIRDGLRRRSRFFEKSILHEGVTVYCRFPEAAPVWEGEGREAVSMSDAEQRRTEAEKWMGRAQECLQMNQVAIGSEFYRWACFFSHQTIEMALKALAYHKGDQDHLHSHDLIKLLDNVLPAFGQLDRFSSRPARITGYYTAGRYPGHDDEMYMEPWRQESGPAMETAEQIYEAAAAVIFGCRQYPS